ncbi:hypothetical protein ACOJBM_42075 [Rhizobium beringeri]
MRSLSTPRRPDLVDAKLKEFRPQLFGKEGLVRSALRDQGMHFMSITVVRGDVGEPTHLVFEMSVDGEPQHAFDTVGTKLASFVSDTPVGGSYSIARLA